MPSRSLMSTKANCSDDNSPPHWFPPWDRETSLWSKYQKWYYVSNYTYSITALVDGWYVTLLLSPPPSSHVMNAPNELTGSRPRPNKDSALTTAMVIKQTTNNEHMPQSECCPLLHLCSRLVTRGAALCLGMARWQQWALGRHIQHIVIIISSSSRRRFYSRSPIFPKTTHISRFEFWDATFCQECRIVTGNGK